MRALLINDTSRINHHGCKILNKNLNKIFEIKKIQVIKRCFNAENYQLSFRKIKNIDFDIILVNGEGTMHHDQKEFLNIIKLCTFFFNKKIPVYLINATIEGISKKYISTFKKFKKIYVRENFSKNFLSRNGIKSKIVSDLIFYDKPNISYKKKFYDLIITDSTIEDDTRELFLLFNKLKKNSIFIPCFYLSKKQRSSITFRCKILIYRLIYLFFKNKLNVFSIFTLDNYKELINKLQASHYLISGRFHIIALAILYQIPFYYISSNTYKIDGLVNDVKIKDRKVDLKTFTRFKKKKFTNKEINFIQKYLEDSKIKIDKMFNQIINDKRL
jgi:hypothetical protein